MFKINVGSVDRIIRIVLGFGLLVLFFYLPDNPRRWLTLIGLVPLVTGIAGTCLVYSVFGLSTCTAKRT